MLTSSVKFMLFLFFKLEIFLFCPISLKNCPQCYFSHKHLEDFIIEAAEPVVFSVGIFFFITNSISITECRLFSYTILSLLCWIFLGICHFSFPIYWQKMESCGSLMGKYIQCLIFFMILIICTFCLSH